MTLKKINRKFKLIKTYPGYQILGAIAYKQDEYYIVINPDGSISNTYTRLYKNIVENQTEYWELITKKKL